MKIYLFRYDIDKTMRSSKEPIKAFTTRNAAQKFADEIYKVKHYPENEWWMQDWEIMEIELDEKI